MFKQLFFLSLVAFNSIFSLPFPTDFKWGISLSAYQNCGANQFPNSNWARWEKKDGSIENNEQSGFACDHWNRYQEDIQLIKQLGLKHVRLSIEWSIIEPHEGVFNQEALAYYRNYIQAFIDNGIEVFVTLYHFTVPQWFEDKGGFEKEENIPYFVRFSKKVYETIGDQVSLWCTINEPTVLLLQAYFRGAYPPGNINPLLGLKVLRNLMKAHTHVYYALKKMAGTKETHIGIAHSYLMFEPYNAWNILERFPGYLFNYLLNETVIEFCTTGTFEIKPWAPQLVSAFLPKGIDQLAPSFFTYKAPGGKKPFDFFGLNYYSHVIIKHEPTLTNPFNVVPSCHDHETMTNMPYPLHGKGLYDAIVVVSKAGLPIFISENGIADHDDTLREQFFIEYLGAVQQAIDEHYNVKGYYYWSLMDNFEWDMGYGKKFGLFEVDFKTYTRTLRNSAYRYIDFIAQAPFR